MTVEVTFSIAVAERSGWLVDGSDSMIVSWPKDAVVAQGQVENWALSVSEQMGRDLGTHLHHGDYIITNSPTTVRAWGIMPEHRDCEECTAGVAAALAALGADPTERLVVGQLYWALNPRERHG